jgi:hypothetical protein
MTTSTTTGPASFITPEALLVHWQGHRRLTRRVLEAFPDEHLFTYSIGGMRPFGALTNELLRMALPTVTGIASGTWETWSDAEGPRTKAELLQRWDADTPQIDTLWRRIPPGRFHETDTAFGRFPGIVYDLVLYVIDNEVHHRAQGYVYLRALGLEPPHFWERD